jgi:hypothetical protein
VDRSNVKVCNIASPAASTVTDMKLLPESSS